MSTHELQTAIDEAKRFIDRAQTLIKALQADNQYIYPRESGDARRSSLDLTRALADLRRR